MTTTHQPAAGPRNRRSSDTRVMDGGGGAPMADVLMKVLDEIDHGLMLVDLQGRMTYANQLALAELRGDGGLRLVNGRLTGRTPADQTTLQTALTDAQRGRRRLFTATAAEGPGVSVAAIPMTTGGDASEVLDTPAVAHQALVLLVFGKRHAVEGLTADFFARGNGLTGAETVVLKALCTGAKPKEIAAAQSIAISTVRSHIASIRAKTQAVSIADLVHRVAVLPPLTSAVKAVPRPGSSAHTTVDLPTCADLTAQVPGGAGLHRRPAGAACPVVGLSV